MKPIKPILFCLLITSCTQQVGQVNFSYLNGTSVSKLENSKDEPNPWISRKELLEYIKNAPKIERTEGIFSPFDTLDYDQIIAYKFWNSGERNPKVHKELLVKDNVRYGSLITEIEEQSALNQKQADYFLKLINKSSSYGGSRMACYEPRFGLVFYKDGEMVTQINICMECNFLKSDVEIPAYEKQKKKGQSIPIEKFRAKDDYGFSKKGWNALADFQKKIGFHLDWE